MVRSAAAGVGNLLVLMGASTGRDGIGGASVLASAELEAGEEKRPSVQIGDPFEESKLLECCLELLDAELLVALQDLGAAGLTSSSAEMAEKGGVGIEIDVEKVPLRNPDLEPFEVMVSESQERMLAVVEPEKLDEVVALCERWQTSASVIGEVTDTKRIVIRRGDEVVGDMPVEVLVDGCPLYDLDPAEPEGWIYANEETLPARVEEAAGAGADPEDPGSVLLALLASPSIASKRWAFEQYDSVVGSRTVRRPETADAAVLRLLETGGAIATSIDGNGRRVACDPYRGTIEAVLECAANLACVGAEPLGLTNCLNFGNPEKPHVAWQLVALRRGARGRLPRARHPGRGRQRVALQRDRVGPDLPHARRRPRRRASRPGARRRPRAAGRRRDRPHRPVLTLARRLGAGEAARRPRPRPSRRPGERRRRRASISCARACGRAASPPPTTPATAESPARSPSARSPAESARAWTSTGSSSCAAPPARPACSARGPGASWSPGAAARSARWWRKRRRGRDHDRAGRRRADRDLGRRGVAVGSASPTPQRAWRSLAERVERAAAAA